MKILISCLILPFLVKFVAEGRNIQTIQVDTNDIIKNLGFGDSNADEVIVYVLQETETVPIEAIFTSFITIDDQRGGNTKEFVRWLIKLLGKKPILNEDDGNKLYRTFDNPDNDDDVFTPDNIRNLKLTGNKDGSKKFSKNLTILLRSKKRKLTNLLVLFLELAFDNGLIDSDKASELADQYGVNVSLSGDSGSSKPKTTPKPKPTKVTTPAPEPDEDSAAAPAVNSTLTARGELKMGSILVSPNKNYEARLQTDGELVVYQVSPKKIMWRSNTAIGVGQYFVLVVETNNDLVLYQAKSKTDPAFAAIWSSRTYNGGGPGPAKLAMQDDGDLVLSEATGKILWSSIRGRIGYQFGSKIKSPQHVLAGDCMTSDNKAYKACLQTDGNFVLSEGSHVHWHSNTPRSDPNFHLHFQSDGNLVFYYKGEAPWHTRSYNKGPGPHSLNLQDDRNLVVYDANGKAHWSSKFGLNGAPGK